METIEGRTEKVKKIEFRKNLKGKLNSEKNLKGNSIGVKLVIFINYHKNLFITKNDKFKVLVFLNAGNTKGGSITVPLASCLTGLD